MKNNKILMIILALVAVAALVFGFVSNGQKADLQTKADELAKKVEELTAELDAVKKELTNAKEVTETVEKPAEGAGVSEELVEAAKAEGELIVYGSCEEDYLAAAVNHFQELYGIKTQYQRLSTGEVPTKIEEENGNPSADVWFGGTNNPYDGLAAKGFLDNSYVPANAKHLTKDIYKDPNGYWYGIYTGLLGFMVNKDEMARLNL